MAIQKKIKRTTVYEYKGKEYKSYRDARKDYLYEKSRDCFKELNRWSWETRRVSLHNFTGYINTTESMQLKELLCDVEFLSKALKIAKRHEPDLEMG